MNLLIDKLPDSVIVCGKSYPVFTDFRHWVRFFCMLEDSELSKRAKLLCALTWFKNEIPKNTAGAIDALLQFAKCEPAPDASAKPTADEQARRKKVFDFAYDSPYIIGGFRQSYGIDLRKEKMHWYEFNALLQSLPETTELKKRISYRSINLAEIKNEEYRSQIARIQNAVRLPCDPLTASDCGNVFSSVMRGGV